MILACYSFVGINAIAQEKLKPKDELKKLLKERYKSGTFVEFVQEGLYVGEYDPDVFKQLASKMLGGAQYEMSTQYYHFYEPNPDIYKYDKHRYKLKYGILMDDNKTYQVQQGAYANSPIEPLVERFRILELRTHDDGITLLLHADQARHGGARNTASRSAQTIGGNTTIMKGQWGVQYKLLFPKQLVEDGDSKAILDEINKILLPIQEAQALKQKQPTSSRLQQTKASATQQNTQDIEIKSGMTRKQVIDALGQPLKAIKLPGEREILEYQYFSIVLMSGKVVEVK
jgi:hypothetical protein